MSLALLQQQNHVVVARRQLTALLQQQRRRETRPGIHPIVRGATRADVTDQGTHAPFPAADVFAPEGTPIYAPERCLSHAALYQFGGYTATLQGLDTRRWYYLAHGERAFAGGEVQRGQQIGAVGSTGTGPGGYTSSGGTSPHVHLALSDDGDFSRGYRGGSGNIWPTPDLWELVKEDYWAPDVIASVAECPQDAVESNWPLIRAALERLGGGSRASLAGAIGTVAIETRSTFEPVREAFWLSETWRRLNLRYYPWYGRGFIQLTWESNYQAASDYLGIDLMSDPDRAMDPSVAAEVFAWYWCVARPAIPMLCDQRDWTEVRRLVQGGSSGLDRLVNVAETLLAA